MLTAEDEKASCGISNAGPSPAAGRKIPSAHRLEKQLLRLV
jgi:hypothetical protein